MFRKKPFSIVTSALMGGFATVAFSIAPVSAQSGVVAKTDAQVAAAMADPRVQMVRNISYRELKPGTPIVEGSGQLIGTVERVAGNTIIISDGTQAYRVPIEQLYAYTNTAGDHFASRLPRAQLERVAQLGG